MADQSFTKRQKERQRKEKQQAKAAKKADRKRDKALGLTPADPDEMTPEQLLEWQQQQQAAQQEPQ